MQIILFFFLEFLISARVHTPASVFHMQCPFETYLYIAGYREMPCAFPPILDSHSE